MSTFGIVVMQPNIQISLQLIIALIQVLSECNLIEFLQDGFMEPLTDAIGLGMLDLGLGVVDVINGKE